MVRSLIGRLIGFIGIGEEKELLEIAMLSLLGGGRRRKGRETGLSQLGFIVV